MPTRSSLTTRRRRMHPPDGGALSPRARRRRRPATVRDPGFPRGHSMSRPRSSQRRRSVLPSRQTRVEGRATRLLRLEARALGTCTRPNGRTSGRRPVSADWQAREASRTGSSAGCSTPSPPLPPGSFDTDSGPPIYSAFVASGGVRLRCMRFGACVDAHSATITSRSRPDRPAGCRSATLDRSRGR
jgi:hypothetical protein